MRKDDRLLVTTRTIYAVHQGESLENPLSKTSVSKTTTAGNGCNAQSSGHAEAVTARPRRNARGKEVSGARGSEALPWLALHLATVLWGTQHAVIKQLVDSGLDASVLNMERFGIAASTSVAIVVARRFLSKPSGSRPLPGFKLRRFPPRHWRRILGPWSGAIELGLWMFLGYAFQSIGLANTSAARSSFLLYLNVKIVPFLAAFFLRRRIPRITWISAALAFLGTLMLSFDGAPPSVGDAWSVAAACASAVFILRLERVASHLSATEINALSLTTVTVLAVLWAALQVDAAGTVNFAWSSLGNKLQLSMNPAVLYLGLATTALSGWLQAIGQESISAERAAIIYALDPVYGAAFAYLLLGETLGAKGIAGALVVFLASFISQGAIKSWLWDILETQTEHERERAR